MARHSEIQSMTINQYLSLHSRKRNLDKVFIKWFMIRDNSNPEKTKGEWDSLLNEFFTEV